MIFLLIIFVGLPVCIILCSKLLPRQTTPKHLGINFEVQEDEINDNEFEEIRTPIESVEPLMPDENFRKGKADSVYETYLAGIIYEDEFGNKRIENAYSLDKHAPVYLYWQLNNEYDKNAIIVSCDNKYISEIGYIPRNFAKKLITEYKLGYVRYAAKIIKIVRRGDRYGPNYEHSINYDYSRDDEITDIVIRINAFYNSLASQKMKISDYLHKCEGIQAPVINRLKELNILNRKKLSAMSDNELLKIKGIGKKAVASIRKACPPNFI